MDKSSIVAFPGQEHSPIIVAERVLEFVKSEKYVRGIMTYVTVTNTDSEDRQSIIVPFLGNMYLSDMTLISAMQNYFTNQYVQSSIAARPKSKGE